MFCPYCGSEILDNSKFCPDCGRAIKKEKIIPEEKPIYSEREKIYYDWLYNFLQENQGKAFTVRAFQQRLDLYNEKKLGSFLQNLLNKMTDKDIIKSTLHNGETYYFFPETFRGEFKQPEIFDSGPEFFDSVPEFFKSVPEKQKRRKSSVSSSSGEAVIYGVGAVLLIIGMILIGVGMAPLNLALIATGGVLTIISICILTQGTCVECCGECG